MMERIKWRQRGQKRRILSGNINKDELIIKQRAKVMLLIGIILVLAMVILRETVATDSLAFTIVVNFFCNLGGTLTVAGIVAIGLEFISYVDYAKNKLKELLIDDQYVNTLEEKKLKELQVKIEERLLFGDFKPPQNSFFKIVHQDIEPLLEGIFIEHYDIVVDCRCEDSTIKKDVHITMYLSSMKRKNGTSLKLYKGDKKDICSLVSIEGFSPEDIYELKSFMINGEELVDDVKVDYKAINELPYNTDIVLDMTAISEKTSIKSDVITTHEIRFSTIVPETDNIQTSRVQYPTRNYTYTMNYDETQVRIRGEGFGFMDSERNTAIINHYRNSTRLRFNDWILPGDGALFVIEKVE